MIKFPDPPPVILPETGHPPTTPQPLYGQECQRTELCGWRGKVSEIGWARRREERRKQPIPRVLLKALGLQGGEDALVFVRVSRNGVRAVLEDLGRLSRVGTIV